MNKILCLLSNNTSTGLSLSDFSITQGKVLSTAKKVSPCSFVPLFECRSSALNSSGPIGGIFSYEINYDETGKKRDKIILNIPFIAESLDGRLFFKTAPDIIGSKIFYCESVFTSTENKYSEILLNLTDQEEYE